MVLVPLLKSDFMFTFSIISQMFRKSTTQNKWKQQESAALPCALRHSDNDCDGGLLPHSMQLCPHTHLCFLFNCICGSVLWAQQFVGTADAPTFCASTFSTFVLSVSSFSLRQIINKSWEDACYIKVGIQNLESIAYYVPFLIFNM